MWASVGDSLCYAFIGFDTDKASEDAYFKMNNVLIDDRRIKARSQTTSHPARGSQHRASCLCCIWTRSPGFGNM